MEGFGRFLGGLIAVAMVWGAIAAVIFLIRLIIALLPVILGLAILLFLGYALVVGLIQIGSGNVK